MYRYYLPLAVRIPWDCKCLCRNYRQPTNMTALVVETIAVFWKKHVSALWVRLMPNPGTLMTASCGGQKVMRLLLICALKVQLPNICGFWFQIHAKVWNQKPQIMGIWLGSRSHQHRTTPLQLRGAGHRHLLPGRYGCSGFAGFCFLGLQKYASLDLCVRVCVFFVFPGFGPHPTVFWIQVRTRLFLLLPNFASGS